MVAGGMMVGNRAARNRNAGVDTVTQYFPVSVATALDTHRRAPNVSILDGCRGTVGTGSIWEVI